MIKIASMQFLTMSFPMENSPVLIVNILPRPPWRYLFTDTGRNPGSATHKERQAAKGMAVPKASAAKKFRRLITNTTLSKFTWKSILCAAEGKSG